MKKNNISAVVITKNEQDCIGDCIDSLQAVVDEIIIVDSGSTDRTVEISRQKGATVYVKDWEGYGANKNFGALKAQNDWILSLDADEFLNDALRQHVSELQPDESKIYAFRCIINYCGTWLKYSEWKPHLKPRIYHRKISEWNLRIVHEDLEHKKPLKTMVLDGAMHHYSYRTYQEHKDRAAHYADLSARQWLAEGYKPSLIKRTFGPTFRFVKSFVVQLGFLHGKKGYRIAKMGAYSVRLKINYFDQLNK